MTRTVSRSVEHVGEWKVAVGADSLEEVYAEVARVVARSFGTPPPRFVTDGEWETVVLTARDRATLLVDWANELIGRSEAAGKAYLLLRDVRIHQGPTGETTIAAQLLGTPTDGVSPLKAATYHGLGLKERGARWHAVLLFDV